MGKRKTLWIVIGVIVIIAFISSGWVYNLVRNNNQLLKSNEMATLQTTFVQQYGSNAVIKQLVSPEKVYAALWNEKPDGTGINHVSWNIGGLWVTVWSTPTSNPTPEQTP